MNISRVATLSQLRRMEDRALLKSEDRVLSLIQERRSKLLDRLPFQATSQYLKGKLVSQGIDTEELLRIKNILRSQGKSIVPVEHAAFAQEFPLAMEVDVTPVASTFVTRMRCIAGMIRKQNSLIPGKEHLSVRQLQEVVLLSGGQASPEGIAHGIDMYIANLRKQVAVARELYLGRIPEGLTRFEKLPKEVKTRVDELLWQAAEGESQVSSEMVIEALLHSVEEQMGMHETEA